MKFKTFLILHIFLFFSAYKEALLAQTNLDNNKNLEIYRKLTKAIETGDIMTINSLLAPDIINHSGPNGREVTGHDSVAHILSGVHQKFKNLKLTVIADATNGDYIFSLIEFSSSVGDSTMGVPAGTLVNYMSVDVAKMREGLIYEHWKYIDPAEMMKELKEMHLLKTPGTK